MNFVPDGHITARMPDSNPPADGLLNPGGGGPRRGPTSCGSQVTVAVIDRDGTADARQLDDVVVSSPGSKILHLSPKPGRGFQHASSLETIHPSRDSLAAACNVALSKARTPYVAFVPVGARPSLNWLDPAVGALERAEGLSAVRCGITGPAPKAVTVLGLPGLDLAAPETDSDALSVSLDGSVLKVRHARSIGGFASLRDWNGLGMNIGWRLWLSGGSVRWCLESAIEAGPGDNDPRWVLEAAAASVQTCWDDRRRRAALEELEAMYEPGLVAAEAVRWGRERASVQGARRRGDVELLRLFEAPAADSPLRDSFGHSRRVLVVTDDVLSQAMAGPAIRAWHIAEELSGDAHEVRLATTTGICERKSNRFEVTAPHPERWTELERWCDIIVHQGYALTKVPQLRGSSKIMVCDAYDPIQLEVLELSKGTIEPERTDAIDMAVKVLNDQLRRADFVMCASEKQRDLWTGTLASLGRVSAPNYDADPTLYRLIDVAPFGLPPEPPVKTHSALRGVVPGIESGDRVIIWGGGLYNWFDPITLIQAVDRLKEKVPTVRLFFMGGRHPNPLTPEMRTSYESHTLSDRLGLTGVHVFFNEGWVDYEQRHNYLLDADIGASLHLHHIETAFSFRTRILDYIWAGLPIVATSGDAFAEMIERHGLGLVVPPQDPGATAEALRRLLEDDDLAKAAARAAEGLRSMFAWPQAMQPLRDFCREPAQAPDRIRPPGSPPRRDGLPSRLERADRLRQAALRRYRRGGIPSVAEGIVNTGRRISSRGAR